MTLPTLALIVDDDDDDRFLLENVIKRTTPDCQVAFARDGQHALEVLALLPSCPTFILSDLNMPRMNGLELLKVLKASKKWQLIPVILFTTTPTAETINEAYRLNVNGLVGKPSSFLELEKVWHEVYTLWGVLAKRPR
ncbi:hypothetical protein BWI93_09775 [Siphonobacter sp. BAB-5385]|uniref:response regulator n=1 Tax=Siphonobacter sp. BAB-5385 TaxID=1864822 RepID=UPI000B9EB8F0|nr:response regulator [Siphonobacter sp. BAB-5385]OZI08336.1 hypothetical protein BWI93_09775 [Siphonobacter sp. BAB-5385]